MTRAATLMLAATGIIAGSGAAWSSNGLLSANVATSSYIHAGLFPDSTTAPVVIDGFENIDHWKATPSDGVRLALAQDAGLHGKSMRLDFDFQGHGGQGVRVPPGGLIVRSPIDRPLRGATLNGKAMQVRGSDVLVRTLPASVVLRY